MDTGIVRDGWLLKSPPEKNFCKAVNLSSLRPKWHKRWFVLRHSGQLPGQYVLEYFTDASCRKRRGQIDLDQCERVDSGLTFANKKHDYRFMFDIRTPKRIYYLVAESEIEMLKWVDCICSVCGLKIEVEDEEEATPRVEPLAVGALQMAGSISSTSSPTTPVLSTTNLTRVPSDSSPYIPISECITGRPISCGLKPTARSSDNLNLVVLPMRRASADNKDLLSNDEFYDHPRNNCLTVIPANISNPSELYRIPSANHKHTRSEERSDWDSGFNDDDSLPLCPPPMVNWNTYPHDLTTDKPISSSTYDVPVSSSKVSKPSFLILDPVSRNTEFEVKGTKYVRCEKVKPKDNHPVPNGAKGSIFPPPRPPKPAFLDKRKYENFEPENSKVADAHGLYDVPPLPTSVSKEIQENKSVEGEVFSFMKEEVVSPPNLSPSAVIPLPAMPTNPPIQKDDSLDDMYDFPRARLDSRNSSSTKLTLKSRSPRQHAYSNAPPSCLNAKDPIMNYEYRPSLPTDSPTDLVESDVSGDVDSPLSLSGATGGTYANLMASPITDGLVPPQINRDLKPKKKGMEIPDAGIGIFNLAPPPNSRSATFSGSIGKPRANPGGSVLTGGLPAIPIHPIHSDLSDEETSNCGNNSRRNSANDDLTKHLVPPAGRKLVGEIQYLELDMDSDNGLQIPKSPDRSLTNTVYKTVDFMKTKALNEMRQNCEESYRKSQ